MANPIDLKLHTELKNAEKINDLILSEAERDPLSVPFELQMIARVRLRFMKELISAKHRGDDISRVSRAVNQMAADMIMEFAMMTVPHTRPDMFAKAVNDSFIEMTHMAQTLAEAYLQAPPATRQ